MDKLPLIAKLLRYYCLVSTSAAGSGHPTSSLSAVELMAELYFGGFLKYDLDKPNFLNNDRVIFSKGHAAPLFYALYAVAGKLSEADLLTLRQFNSPLAGHPSMEFPFTEVATGSLGQGLSVGVGLAINAQYLEKLPYKTYILLGDSEMAEGQVWEAMQLASYYKLTNLVAIVDVNRLGQRGETMLGHDVSDYAYKARAFGWETVVVDGHNFTDIHRAYQKAAQLKNGPMMIIAKTIKGKGISFLENQNGWHGKALKTDQLQQALFELGEIDLSIKAKIAKPETVTAKNSRSISQNKMIDLKKILIKPVKKQLATRKAYGNALAKLGATNRSVVVLDAEMSNSTYADIFAIAWPSRYFEMFIAEQNMISVAVGLSRMGKTPFVSTFASFLTRAFDQIRMAQYSGANIKLIGSHAGVSIGQDGPSQMGLEDMAMFRSIRKSIVFYPSDAVSTQKIVELMAKHHGISYLRTTRMDTPIIYQSDQEFKIGGSQVIYQSQTDSATVIAAGVTLHEAVKAYHQLRKDKVKLRIIDLYCIKPLDLETLKKAAQDTRVLLTVEDHYQFGGLGEAVKSALINQSTPIHSLYVGKAPRSGLPAELLANEKIDATAIVEKIKSLL